MLLLLVLYNIVSVCNAFWFYGYDRVFRDPYSETLNNEIVSTSVITYLASAQNNEVIGIGGPYRYKLILFESIIQYENSAPDNKWNLGVWDSFTYCDDNMNTLCLYFSDGEYCDNGYFRETAIELTCHFDADIPSLYSINEYEECVYTAKLYFPQLCAAQGTNTVFVRDPNEIDKIKTSSYISSKGNKINVLPYNSLSGSHNIGISMTVSEIEDLIRITMYGPTDKYFGIGFGSNGMLNTYAIIINGHRDGNDVYFEQLLDSHNPGYTLEPSFILDEHILHDDGTHQITLSRKLSSAVEIDQYWLFSCIDDYIDIIWSVGKSTSFERHIAFGQDRLKYDITVDESYDKSKIINNWDSGNDAFKLKINWTSIFILTILGVIGFYIVRKYKQNIIDFTSNITGTNNGNQNQSLYPATSNQQYGSAHDTEPLIGNKL